MSGVPESTGQEWGRDAFVAAFGHLEAGASNGRFDNWRDEQRFVVADLLERSAAELKFFISDETDALQRSVWQEITPRLPSYLVDFAARPVLSVGTAASATFFHQHDETWFAEVAGRKAWWIGGPNDLNKLKHLDPGSELLPAADRWPASLRFFVQQPGEILYIPAGMPHATLNFDEFVFGIGAQGHLETWPEIVLAAKRGDVQKIGHLVAVGTSPDTSSPSGTTAWHYAVLRNDSAMLEILMAQNSPPPTALHLAAQRGHSTVSAMLLDRRAALEAKNSQGLSPLGVVSQKGHVDVADLLLKRRAQVDATGPRGETPLHCAADSGCVKLVELLASRNAALNARDTEGLQPLHWAAEQGHLSTATALVAHGASANVEADDGSTPLIKAALTGHVALAQWLLSDLSVDCNAADGEEWTAAHFAAAGGHVPVLRLLATHDADFDTPTEQGFTPATIATGAGHSEVASFLFLES